MLGRTIAFAAALLVAGATVPAPVRAATAPDCPNGGTVRFGIEPYESAARMVPAFDALAKLISQKLGCDVQIFIPTSYNAEIEAMRAGKLEAGEFGPLGYVLAAPDRQRRRHRDLQRRERQSEHATTRASSPIRRRGSRR